MASTPATNVVATAPMPGIMTPNFPRAGWILTVSEFDEADFWRLAIAGTSLIRNRRYRQTGMFSY
jgi:hypothetical protein